MNPDRDAPAKKSGPCALATLMRAKSTSSMNCCSMAILFEQRSLLYARDAPSCSTRGRGTGARSGGLYCVVGSIRCEAPPISQTRILSPSDRSPHASFHTHYFALAETLKVLTGASEERAPARGRKFQVQPAVYFVSAHKPTSPPANILELTCGVQRLVSLSGSARRQIALQWRCPIPGTRFLPPPICPAISMRHCRANFLDSSRA